MADQQRSQARQKQPISQEQSKKKSDAAGISNRPPAEEQHEQEELPPRGQAKESPQRERE